MIGTCALLVLTDGRPDVLDRTLHSLDHQLGLDTFSHRLVVDDSIDPTYGTWLDSLRIFDTHISAPTRRGFAGAIHVGWEELPQTDWVFHLEDDFEFAERVDLQAMADVLNRNPHLAQMSLRRQPWGPEEVAAGGFVEMHPELYQDCHDDAGHHWLEHRVCFTTNPSLYRHSLTRAGWPQIAGSEAAFSWTIFSDPATACGIWGRREDPPAVQHIGAFRKGSGY